MLTRRDTIAPLENPRNLFRWSVATSGVVCAALVVCSWLETSAQEKPAAAAASTSVIKLESARLIFVDRREVAFDHPGVLQFVVEEAETVTEGQVVARLDDRVAKAALAVADARILNNAEVISAQKQAELAQLKSTSAKKANEEHRQAVLEEASKNATPPTPADSTADSAYTPIYPEIYFDELRLTYEAALADVGRFEKEHEVNLKGRAQAQAELETLELKAPRKGLVTRAFKQSGEGTQSGEKILEIISTERIRVEVDVPAVTAARLKVGMSVTVIVEQPSGMMTMASERYPTVLKFIDPTIGQVSKKVRIFADLDNSHGKLREGLTASMEVFLEATPPATKPE